MKTWPLAQDNNWHCASREFANLKFGKRTWGWHLFKYFTERAKLIKPKTAFNSDMCNKITLCSSSIRAPGLRLHATCQVLCDDVFMCWSDSDTKYPNDRHRKSPWKWALDWRLWQRESRRVKISESQSIVYKSSSFIGHDKSLFFCVLLAVGGAAKYLVEAHRASHYVFASRST